MGIHARRADMPALAEESIPLRALAIHRVVGEAGHDGIRIREVALCQPGQPSQAPPRQVHLGHRAQIRIHQAREVDDLQAGDAGHTPIGPRPTLRYGMREDTKPARGVHPVNDLLRVARAPFEAAGQIEG